jgi:iron(III) transport system ATP-binding protein
MRGEVRRILKGSNCTAVFVTHDQQEALLLGDRVAVMRQGYVEQIDAPDVVYHRPQNRFVAEFMGAADFLPVQATAAGLESEIGRLPAASSLPPSRQAEAMVRPHDLRVTPAVDGAGHGLISAAEFVGDLWQYSVRLPSGRTLRCQAPHTEAYALGTSVTVRLEAGHGLVCFERGQRVS